jgi:hypothetical protein
MASSRFQRERAPVDGWRSAIFAPMRGRQKPP